MTATAVADARPQYLTDGEEAVTAAGERVSAAWSRIDDLQARRLALQAQIGAETDAKALEKLRRQRREVAAELDLAPEDVVALSELYAQALLSWGTAAWAWSRMEIRAANEERAEPARAAARARATVDPSQPTGSRNPETDAAAHAELNELAGPLAALRERIRAAESYGGAARSRVTSHLGDTSGGDAPVLSPGALPRWLDGVRRRAHERAGTNHHHH